MLTWLNPLRVSPDDNCQSVQHLRLIHTLLHPEDYCIRCCQNSADCPTGRSTAGCASLIPGDYSIVLSTNSPLTQPGSAPVSNAHAAAVKEVIWTAPTRQEVASNATLQKALQSSVFPLGVGLDKPYK